MLRCLGFNQLRKDTKALTRSRKSKDRHYNGQKKKNTRVNNGEHYSASSLKE